MSQDQRRQFLFDRIRQLLIERRRLTAIIAQLEATKAPGRLVRTFR